MKQFLVIFREPDGRKDTHPEAELLLHRQHWAEWMKTQTSAGSINGGNSLALGGNLIRGRNAEVSESIHQVGTEIVGGFLLITAENLQKATDLMRSCPVYEFDGYVEVREIAG